MRIRKWLVAAAIGALALTGAGCSSDADVASKNLSKDAENFKILRRIVFYNGITAEYVLEITGYCSVETEDIGIKGMEVTCKVGEGQYKKHYLGEADNVTWFAEQIESAGVSTKFYKVVFKPTVIIPQPEIR